MAGTEAGVTLGQPHLSRQDLTTLVRREFGVGRARHLRGAVLQGLPWAILCPVLEGWLMIGSSENLPRLACFLFFCSYQRVVRKGEKVFMKRWEMFSRFFSSLYNHFISFSMKVQSHNARQSDILPLQAGSRERNVISYQYLNSDVI